MQVRTSMDRRVLSAVRQQTMSSTLLKWVSDSESRAIGSLIETNGYNNCIHFLCMLTVNYDGVRNRSESRRR